MVKICTRLFGELDVPAEKVFTFAAGLFGFSELQRFAVIELPQGEGLLHWLQPLDQADIGFVVADPVAMFPDYLPEFTPGDLAAVGASSSDDLLVRVIAVVPADPRLMTVNLQAPILFNPYTRQARQVILDDPRYSVRQPLEALPSQLRTRVTAGGERNARAFQAGRGEHSDRSRG